MESGKPWPGEVTALLSIVLMKPAMYDNKKRVWTATEAAYSSSLDLSGQGMLRLAEWQPDAGPLDACLLANVPVLNCTSSLNNLFHKRLLKSPVFYRSALGTQRVWFLPQASLVPQDLEVLGSARSRQGFSARSSVR